MTNRIIEEWPNEFLTKQALESKKWAGVWVSAETALNFLQKVNRGELIPPYWSVEISFSLKEDEDFEKVSTFNPNLIKSDNSAGIYISPLLITTELIGGSGSYSEEVLGLNNYFGISSDWLCKFQVYYHEEEKIYISNISLTRPPSNPPK